MRIIIGLLTTFGATVAAAIVGSAASITAADFYGRLVQPPWAPPSWVFGPVWTILYVLMAIAGWLVYQSGASNTKALMGLFLAQLILNALWSWTFFQWESGLGSFITILGLWVAILVLIVTFWRVHPAAGVLLIPYLVWVSFAATLNGALWRLNPGFL